jgi:hypothetical protein
MRKNRIHEQDATNTIIRAPKNEIERFQTGVLATIGGNIVNLCNGANGNPKEFRVGGKTYFIAKKTPKDNYLTYDGRVLKKREGECEYAYLMDGTKIVVVAGVSEQGLDNPMKQQLMQFGINPDDNTLDVYNSLEQWTKYLQKNLVDKGAVSVLFKLWNELIRWYYPTDWDKKILTPNSKVLTDLEPSKDQNVLTSRYTQGDAKNIGLTYNGQPFTFWFPKNASQNIVGNTVTTSSGTCSDTLATYIINGLQVKAGADSPLPQLQTIKAELSKCYATGSFDNFTGFTSTNMNPGTRKKLSPYGFLNKNLSIREIKKLLKSDKIAPSHTFDFDNTGGNKVYANPQMNEIVNLKSIIKNKLSVLSENKQKQFISESKIIKSRFNVISEAKISRDRISTRLINESFEMVSLGMNEKLIAEGLMDTLKGMFGFGAEGVVEFFKEKLVESVMKKLSIPTDGWLGGVFVKAIGNIPVGDWFSGKVFKCDYLVPAVAKAIAEESIDKAKDNAGLTGGFYDVLRNAIVNGLEETSFGQSLERGLSTMLCPLLTNVKDKMTKVSDTMKQKAIA